MNSDQVTRFQSRLLAQVASRPGATDRQLAEALLGEHVHPSRVNQEARLLGRRQKLFRQIRNDGRIGNYPASPAAKAMLDEAIGAAKPNGIATTVRKCPVETRALITAVKKIVRVAGAKLNDIQTYWSPAPHRYPKALPNDKQAVYCFFVGNRCLKVGKTGPRNNTRFQYHHYGCHSTSSLSKSILARRHEVAEYLSAELRAGLEGLDKTSIGDWVLRNTSRLNLVLPAAAGKHVLSLIESYLHVRFEPVFEGRG